MPVPESMHEAFRLLGEAVGAGLIVVDQEGTILLANARAEGLFGYGKGELPGRATESLIPGRFRGRHPALRSGYFADPQVRAMGMGRDLFGLRKDGSEFPIEIGLNPIVMDAGTLVVSAIVDITERKRAEGGLRAARDELEATVRERTRELAEANRSLEARVADHERAAAALAGQTEELNARRLTAVRLAKEAEEARRLAERSGERLAATNSELERENAARRRVEAALLVTVAERDRAEERLTETVRQLERVNAERTAELERLRQSWQAQQEQLAHVDRLNTLGEMASGLAHELNQPLMAIMGFAGAAQQLLRRESVERDGMAALLGDVTAQAGHAGEVIRRLRALIRSPDRRPAPCDLNQVVNDALELLGRELAANGVMVKRKMAAVLPPLTIDAVQIQQVVLNIVRNSIQAMAGQPVEGRALSVRTWLSFDRAICVVEIADSGPGISGEHAQRLFEPFFTTKVDGLGLGLPISRTILRRHGGRLELVRSEPDGTTFHLTLPVTRPEA